MRRNRTRLLGQDGIVKREMKTTTETQRTRRFKREGIKNSYLLCDLCASVVKDFTVPPRYNGEKK